MTTRSWQPGQPSRVVGLVYLVIAGRVKAAIVEDGRWHWTELTDVASVLTPAAKLRDELADKMAVARRRLSQLDQFVQGWGRRLLPAEILHDPPDVLVLVPHAALHLLPLHLVSADDGMALACHSGITYSSSLSLFCRNAIRNRARQRETIETRKAAGGGTDVSRLGNKKFRQLAEIVLGEFSGSRVSAPMGRFEVKKAMRDDSCGVVCIVAHGFVDPDQHRDSGLLLDHPAAMLNMRLESAGLGGMGVSPDDRVGWPIALYGTQWEIIDLPLRDFPARIMHDHPAEILTVTDLGREPATEAELVMLLACSAGMNVVLQGDEPASLAEAFLRLGASSVIAPMWDCDYALADVWARAFIGSWAREKTPKALAAREAFRAMGDGSDAAALGPLHLRGDWR
jgi:hypothetical protein